jgi:hypothetical protein
VTAPTKLIAMAIGCLASLVAASGHAANVTFSGKAFHPNQAMVNASNGGLTLQSRIYMIFVTTDADILSVNQVHVSVTGGGLFQVPAPFGSNIERPAPEFIAINPALAADSWVTTPGATSRLGADLPGDGTGSWGDLSNDGPQTNFQVAQFTLPAFPATGTFSLRVSVAGATGPEAFWLSPRPLADPPLFPPLPFPTLPEPGSASLLALGLLALGAVRRHIIA